MDSFKLFSMLPLEEQDSYFNTMKITVKSANQSIENIHYCIQNLYQGIENFSKVIKNISDLQETIFPKIVEIISNLQIPGYTAEKKQVLINSHMKWGKYGWTYNAETPLVRFDKEPLSQEDADQQMMQYCTIENIRGMVAALIDINLDKDDLEEALFCYENGKYKSCTMLLFSLLDKMLIERKFQNPKGRWKTGYSAATELENKTNGQMENNLLCTYLMFINQMECLKALF